MVEIFVQPLVCVCCARINFILRLSFKFKYFILRLSLMVISNPRFFWEKGIWCAGSYHCAPDPGASKPAKALRSFRYALPSTVTSFNTAISMCCLILLNHNPDVNKPLFLASKENRFLKEFFLYILEDLHTRFTSAPPAAAAARFAALSIFVAISGSIFIYALSKLDMQLLGIQ